MHNTFVDVEDLESQVVVLHPCIDVAVMIQLERIGGLPRAVINAKINVRTLGKFAWLASIPSPHVVGRNDGSLSVEDRNHRFGIFRDDAFPHVLNQFAKT